MRNTSKMIKETISPVQNTGTQMSQEEKLKNKHKKIPNTIKKKKKN